MILQAGGRGRPAGRLPRRGPCHCGRIGTGEKVQPSQIADEIAIALICTALGLITAIQFTYLLASLNIRMRILQNSLASGMTRFLEHFKKLKA